MARLPKLAGRSAAKISPKSSSTYTADGLAQSPNLSELGSGRPVQVVEIVPELSSPYTRLITYKRMMNDAAVDVSMRAAKTPVLGADFFVEPASTSQQDLDAAEFIEANLFGGMAAPFLNSLEDILHMFEDGYSVIEKNYENRTWAPSRTGANGKMYTMLKSLAPRPISTIKDIAYDDNGHLDKLTQSAILADNSTSDKQLDHTKVLVFTFARNGSDLTGKSLLRTAYPHWYYKTHLYKIDAIQKERNSLGVPKGKLLPGYTQADVRILSQLLRNIRSNEEGFIMETPNVEITFEQVHGSLVNVLESSDHHNVMILMNVLAQFLSLGVGGAGGGRATAASQTDIFMKSLRYIANYIVDIINMYLIPELIVWNFPTNRFPKLQVRNIGETKDLQSLASGLASLFSQEAITPDRDTENWIRRTFDMPFKRDDQPGTTANAKQQAVVTLYDAAGNPTKAIPVGEPATQPQPVAGFNDGAANSQRGSVKANGNGKGSGYVGAPVSGS